MLFFNIYCNTSQPKGYYFQNAATDTALDIIKYHDIIQFYLIIVIVAVTWFLIFNIVSFIEYKNRISIVFKQFFHGTLIETVWTIIPAVVLYVISQSSFNIIYQLDCGFDPSITVKCTGSQWYWTYELHDHSFDFMVAPAFDSYMKATEELSNGELRLQHVDFPLILPYDSLIRILVTTTDVIHSFSVPSLGIKIDTIPGRLSQSSFIINRPGVYFGACQEICGIQHSYMPIQIYAVSYTEYLKYYTGM